MGLYKESWIRLYSFVKKIPRGKVATYSQLAKLAGIKNPRVVGNILHKNSDPIKIPYHRVVTSSGSVSKSYAYGGNKAQSEKLKTEGVKLLPNGKVDLVLSLWNGVY